MGLKKAEDLAINGFHEELLCPQQSISQCIQWVLEIQKLKFDINL